MKKRFNKQDNRDVLRDKIMGLGERSLRKSYYPELKARLAELEKSNALLKQEIEERTDTEKALLESKARFRDLANLLPGTIFETDRAGTLVFVNQHGFEHFGYCESDLDERLTVLDMIAPYDQTRVLDNIKRVMNGEQIGLSEYTLVKKDQSTFPGIIRSAPIVREGRVEGLRGFVIDITDRKLSEQALRESEEKYRTLVENQTDLVVKVDLQGRFLFVSPSYCRLFGYSEEELLGRNYIPLVHEEDRETISRAMEKMLSPPYSVSLEHRAMTRDGWRWLAWANTAVLDEEGRVTAFIGSGRDITERKRFEEESKRLETQLHQARKMEAIGTLAGGIAHDFNNLLQAITGYTEILLIGKPENDNDSIKLNAIRRITERAAQLVQQLLLFSRKVESEHKPVDINLIVEETGRMLERTIPKMIDIEIHPGRDLQTIDADRIQIERILLNLGSNAADAMPDGGKFIIRTDNIYLDQSFCKRPMGTTPGEYVLMSITDTGHGMDPDTVEHIFEPFYTTKDIGKGTGLGLASVYGIVKNHGAHITCHSEKGKGTTFDIYFPAVQKRKRSPKKQPSKPPFQGGKETILLVDDEYSIRDFTSEILRRFGFTVLTANNGEEALEIYTGKEKSIDLVILDIGMPGMGGHQCLQKLQQMDPSVKVIIASGYSNDERVKKTVESGAARFVGKPFHIDNLLNNIRELTSSNHSGGDPLFPDRKGCEKENPG